ncbi:Histone-lysine N-methyltransferase SETMAR [Habropoda laboriosa]|uniref:Histone-lysine N-methyltransferase SETMAR n=1 Tax=Habropoda laboriosa TaxID=597456 RepID=A0A0L7QM79_9HYME|nr:Histone-lysine N-methyltransferase SETMAR [Habropoda laboriosa]
MLLLCHWTVDSSLHSKKQLSDLVEFWRFYNKGKMEEQTVHSRHILLFYFRKGENARQACAKLRTVYGDNALQECSINTTREIAETLNIHHSSVRDHLKKLGYVSRLDIWVPRVLKEVHLTARMNICDILIKREKNDPFLKRLITGDEKWIVYNKIFTYAVWHSLQECFAVSEAARSCMNGYYRMVCIMFTHSVWLAVIYTTTQSATNNKYNTVNEKLNELGYETLSHPAYFPDLSSKNGNVVNKPSTAVDYNNNMSSIDRADQMSRFHSVRQDECVAEPHGISGTVVQCRDEALDKGIREEPQRDAVAEERGLECFFA